MQDIERPVSRPDLRARLAERAGATTPQPAAERSPLDLERIATAIRDFGRLPMDHELPHHVTLTPRVPYVEGRGFLNVLGARWYAADADQIELLTEIGSGHTGDPNPMVDVWLDGLALDKRYAVVLRVAGDAIPGARFKVSHSEGQPIETDMEEPGPEGQLVVVLLDSTREVDGALLHVEALGTGSWRFYDAVATEFGA